MKMTNEQLMIELVKENRKYRDALKYIAAWELPPSTMNDYTLVNLGKAKNPTKIPCSYETAFGSSGARDLIRSVAREALKD